MKRVFEAAVILIGTLGWWGFIYPELCMAEGTFEAAEGESDASEKMTLSGECEGMEDFLAGKGNIRIKCKAIEYLCQVKEKTNSEKDESND